MQLITNILLVITFLGFFSSINGQNDILLLRPHFFTPRNFKITLGGSISGNLVTNDDKQTTFMNQFKGQLPTDLTIRYDTTSYPVFNLGLNLDISSPNSIMGFVIGTEYQTKAFQLQSGAGGITSYEVSSIRIPAYLKLQLGSVHARNKALLMFGGIYTIPNSLDKTGKLGISMNKKELQNYLSLSGLIGWQIGFGKTQRDKKIQQAKYDKYNAVEKEDKEAAESLLELYESVGVPSRSWFFVRFDIMRNSLFNPSFEDGIMQFYDTSQLSYKDLEITIGAAFFFGAKR